MKKLIIIPATLIVALVTLCSCEKLVGTSKNGDDTSESIQISRNLLSASSAYSAQ